MDPLGTIKIVRLEHPTDAQLDELARILSHKTNAFVGVLCKGDPSLVFEFQRAVVAADISASQYHVAIHEHNNKQDVVGCVALFARGTRYLTSEEHLSTGFKQVLTKAGTGAMLDELRPRFFDFIHKHISPNDLRSAWSLNTLAVAPAFRGRGIAKALMNVGETLAKKDGTLLTFETIGDDVVGMYRHLGYQVMGREDIEFGGEVLDMRVWKKDFNA